MRWPAPLSCAVLLALLAIAVLVAGPALAQDAAPPLVDFDRRGPRLVALVALLAFFLISFFAIRPSVSTAVRAVVFWGALFVGLLAFYAFRHDIETVGREIVAVLVPGQAVVTDGGEVVFRRMRGGHFLLDGEVNGHTVEFLFDTGASTVVLTPEDAAAAGIPVKLLNYSLPVVTANGTSYVAPTRISELTVGPIRVTNVRAAVAPRGTLTMSLLGNTFLDRLNGYQVTRDRLVLTP